MLPTIACRNAGRIQQMSAGREDRLVTIDDAPDAVCSNHLHPNGFNASAKSASHSSCHDAYIPSFSAAADQQPDGALQTRSSCERVI
ncbi:hypothetical protein [Synechococcus sp. FACHB-909]|uniref:hypothetical protein n=1 Tax=Synechococcus sp. FACHB-909 TaxID=2692863 RepID=UPI0016882562|nr:hypothetical protein [Synechococcus sp. FACHB-909]MBD2717906.1 hypothetical protein [Synechococcus sp. FACHB-909]